MAKQHLCRTLVYGLGLLLAAVSVYASPLPSNVLVVGAGGQALTKPKQICFQQNDTDDVDVVRNNSQWKCERVDIKTIGYSSHAYWFHTRYKTSDIAKKWSVQLMYGYGMYDKASAYFVSESGARTAYTNLGAETPFNTKPVKSPELSIPILSDNGKYVDIFVKVRSDKAIIYGPVFGEESVNTQDMYLYSIWVIASSSFTLASILFFFLYSYSGKDKSMALLAIGAILAILWQWSTTGVGYWLFWGNKTHFQLHGVMTFACAGSGALAIFLYYFLRQSVKSWLLAAGFIGAAIFQITLAIGNNIIDSIWWGVLSSWSNLTLPGIMAATIVYIAITRDKTVRWMAVGAVTISFSCSMVAAQTLDIVQLQLSTSPINTLPLLLLFFSLAIMDRRIVRRKLYTKSLEQAVEEKTRSYKLQNETLQQTVKALQEAQEESVRFFRMVTHDLRAPLNNISLRIQSLQHEVRCSSVEQVETELELAEQGIDAASMIINEHLQAFSSVSKSSGFQQVNVPEVIASTILLMTPALTRHGIDVASIWSDSKTPIWAWGNKTRIQNVLENLLTNITRYCPAGSMVNITAKVERGRVMISVHDNGPGLPPEIAENPFDVGGGKTRRTMSVSGSTGQGLYIVKFLALQMQGDIDYVRSNEGISVFTLNLRAVSEQESDALQQSSKDLEHFMAA